MSSPRPKPLGDVDLHEAVAQVRETPDIWKVYQPDWLIVCATTSDLLCRDYFDRFYAGRVRDEDVRYNSAVGGTFVLELRLPNLKGEFKYKHLAEAWVELHPAKGTEIVARSSRAEMKLLEYGKRKLVTQ